MLPALPRAGSAFFEMTPPSRIGHQVIRTLRAVVSAAGVAMGGVAGCITTPPPDLPAPPQRRPTILHASVMPPADVPLVDWPPDGTFIVPVEPGDPELPTAFLWDVFVDYDPSAGTSLEYFRPRNPPVSAVDGGIVAVPFTLPGPFDGFCHRVEFLVADNFNSPPGGIENGDRRYDHTPDSRGGDIVTWQYTGGAPPGGCPSYDAGALQDGTFPPDDAPSDSVPVIHEDAAGK